MCVPVSYEDEPAREEQKETTPGQQQEHRSEGMLRAHGLGDKHDDKELGWRPEWEETSAELEGLANS